MDDDQLEIYIQKSEKQVEISTTATFLHNREGENISKSKYLRKFMQRDNLRPSHMNSLNHSDSKMSPPSQYCAETLQLKIF